jgi:HAD superfamily hydrolase (TIGR01509 family)
MTRGRGPGARGIEAALFDVDGVLACLDEPSAAAFFRPLIPMSPGELGRYWESWLAGRGAAPDGRPLWARFWTDVGAHLALPPAALRTLESFDYRCLYRAFSDAHPALAAAKSGGLRVGVLSNSAFVDLRALLRWLGFGDVIDVTLFPQETGFSKPAPEAYQAALAAVEVAPERCLFFDDVAANVDAAAALGIRAFRVDRSRSGGGAAPAAGVVNDLSLLPRLLGP